MFTLGNAGSSTNTPVDNPVYGVDNGATEASGLNKDISPENSDERNLDNAVYGGDTGDTDGSGPNKDIAPENSGERSIDNADELMGE